MVLRDASASKKLSFIFYFKGKPIQDMEGETRGAGAGEENI